MPAGPVGECWGAGTWRDDAWEAGSWGEHQASADAYVDDFVVVPDGDRFLVLEASDRFIQVVR
jgi:hypothetical protein